MDVKWIGDRGFWPGLVRVRLKKVLQMIPEQVGRLIQGGESLNVEFKGEEKRALNDADLVDAVVCLANRPTEELGWLLVGVEDDGRITGTRPRHESGITDPRRVQALIANRTRPALTCRVELIVVEGKPVLAIEVPRARSPVGTTDGKYLRRAIGGVGQPVCLPYHFHEMQAAQATRKTRNVVRAAPLNAAIVI